MDTNKMTIDKAQLKSLAEDSLTGDWYEAGDLRYEDRKTGDIHGLHHDDDRFIAAAGPATVLALLAEIERLEREADQAKADGADAFGLAQGRADTIDQLKAENEDYKSGQERYEQIIDDLKAENEALRKHIQEGIGLMPLGTAKRAAWVVGALGSTPMAKEASHG